MDRMVGWSPRPISISILISALYSIQVADDRHVRRVRPLSTDGRTEALQFSVSVGGTMWNVRTLTHGEGRVGGFAHVRHLQGASVWKMHTIPADTL